MDDGVTGDRFFSPGAQEPAARPSGGLATASMARSTSLDLAGWVAVFRGVAIIRKEELLRERVRKLHSLGSGSIVTAQMVALDWHDGPLAGFLEFDTPRSAWRFHMFAHAARSGEVDERLYLLSEVSYDGWLRLLHFLSEREGGGGPILVPGWEYDDSARTTGERLVSDLERSAIKPELVLRADVFPKIDGIWVLQ